MAPVTVSWEALRAWTQLMAIDLDPWEAAVLVDLGQRRAVIEMEASKRNARKGQDR